MKSWQTEALPLWQEFHQKDAPKSLLEISSEGGVFPEAWGYLGKAKTCYYRSDKWEDNGTTHDYFHDHGEVECWHPWRAVAGLKKGTPKVKWPDSLVMLGYSLGWDIATPESKTANLFWEIKPSDRALLCAFPDRSALVVLDGKARSWKPSRCVIALFYGPTLTVEDRGIVG